MGARCGNDRWYGHVMLPFAPAPVASLPLRGPLCPSPASVRSAAASAVAEPAAVAALVVASLHRRYPGYRPVARRPPGPLPHTFYHSPTYRVYQDSSSFARSGVPGPPYPESPVTPCRAATAPTGFRRSHPPARPSVAPQEGLRVGEVATPGRATLTRTPDLRGAARIRRVSGRTR